jgi:hypothetical protein
MDRRVKVLDREGFAAQVIYPTAIRIFWTRFNKPLSATAPRASTPGKLQNCASVSTG